jgi:phosphocarrier protein HPr
MVRDLLITNKLGLHARAAARFVKVADQFDAEIEVSKDGERVFGTSILGLMMLGAASGTTISVTAEGVEAIAALDALATLVNNRFDEE